MSYPEKVCLLTGASGKLGSAFCRAVRDEYRMVAVYRRRPVSETLPECMDAIAEIQADLSFDADRERVVDFALDQFGRIDLLVNNAARSIWSPMLTSDRSAESAPVQFEVNVIAPLRLSVLCARKFWCGRTAENLHENRSVINVSSIAGCNVYPKTGQGVYAASKAALNHLSRHLADEFGEIGVRVNAFAPNSFPAILSLPTVVESLRNLDHGSMTGKLLILDRHGETVT